MFVDTNPKNDRVAVLKDHATLKELDEDDSNVFHKSLIDRYVHRPQQLQPKCLAEFAATFATIYKSSNDIASDTCNDVLPSTGIQNCSITLTDGFGKMTVRPRPAVIRFQRYT